MCPANSTLVILPVHNGRPIAPHTTQGGAFPGSQSPGPGPEQDISPPIPVGRFIKPPRRPALSGPPTGEVTVIGASRRSSQPVAHAANAVGDVQLFRNVSLRASSEPVASQLSANDGPEDSVATNGKGVVLYTYNNRPGAALSTDGGLTFSYVNPGYSFSSGGLSNGALFPGAAGGLCCDQVVTYIPSVDRFIWVLQYNNGQGGISDGTNPNVIRVATATSAGAAAGDWAYYDFVPSDWGGALKPKAKYGAIELDRPFVAFDGSNLYLTASAIDLSNSDLKTQVQSLIWRVPLDQLGQTVYPVYYNGGWGGFDGLLRPAQNNRYLGGVQAQLQWFAGRESTSRLFVAYWRSGAGYSLLGREVDSPTVATSNTTTGLPDGSDFMTRYDRQVGLVVTGVDLGDKVWFAWGTGRQAEDGAETLHVQPSIEAVAIDTRAIFHDEHVKWADYASIQYDDVAAALPVMRANSRDDIGIGFMFGGPNFDPQYTVGFLDPYAAAIGSGGNLSFNATATPNYWGDYTGLEVDPARPECFIAGGSAPKSGAGGSSGQPAAFFDPHYVAFGRSNADCRPPQPPPRLSSQIVISSVSVVGGVIMVNGMITPSHGHVPVTVRYTAPSGTVINHVVDADADGSFSDSLTATEQGGWSVSASWPGDSQYQSASTASPSTVTVGSAQLQPSSISMNCPGSAIVGQGVTVTAALTPALQGAGINWTATAPSGAVQTQTVPTDSTGTSYYNPILIEIGTWTIATQWPGDTNYSASSGSCTINVLR